ncbi:MAG TPA: CBS domain-containing protein [bacterium]|jgi:acetoin utilization protein AcuB|nr:CBS domain-containing protein [bacterium]
MTVKDRMSSPAVTATPETRTKDALQTMYIRKIRRMPVVDDRGKLVGIVTQRDLFEKGQADTPVGAIMSRDPYTIAIDTSVVHAATLMRNLGLGGLPVLDHGQLVGIITESDIFDAFLELLGAGRAGTRMILHVSGIAEGVAQILKALAPTGAELTGLTTVTESGAPAVIVTAAERDPRDLVRALKNAGFDPTLISVQDAA